MQEIGEVTHSPDALDDLYDAIVGLLRPGGRPAIPTAVDHAYEMIWRQLVKGERNPGERLADTELALQFGLSRTPVRQALHRLAQEELVRFDARHGFSVRAFSRQDVHGIYDVRNVLEVLALRRAAPRLTRADLEEKRAQLLTARMALETRADQSSLILHLQTDLTFHNHLIRAAGNGQLLRALAALRSQQALFQYRDMSFPEANVAAGEEHEAILLALIAGDVDQAAEQMAKHVTNAKNRVLEDLFGDTETASESGALAPVPQS
jgi:DNA-binding GntR family transcriptional regulator